MKAYYNEIDPYAAAWLRTLISAGHIAPGDVDERDIRDVRPDDLKPYTQCHFFAGIGVWSYALRRAGWPDDRPVWTGSCPCQPFSQAGAGAGFDDERHLWPDFHWLIRERQPPVVFGEQVASKDADPWIDLVQADLEGMAYSFGAVPFPAAGVGSPNIRDRLYWMAHASSARRIGRRPGKERHGLDAARLEPERLRDASRLAHTDHQQRSSRKRGGGPKHEAIGRQQSAAAAARLCDSGGMADADLDRRHQASVGRVLDQEHHPESRCGIDEGANPAGPVNGFWRDADWLGCRDGKFRPVEPGTFPLVDGAAFRLDSGSPFAGKSRVGMLKGAGNAINAEAATTFISAAMEGFI